MVGSAAFAAVAIAGFKLALARMALKGTTPEDRPAILRSLPPVLRSVGSVGRLSLGSKADEQHEK
ncbi:hypothetical protein Rhe02_37740 [Rhizocola hellebori]|uniref:Uncharacterized protein n=1 Tax=Rhizocola hellebori TaxID=1392758 RepID=A0A8J3Q9K3_9ACTN|nr:hypothetical protein Rhe02_37740 [Rhizocola hellebori]